MCLKDIRLSSSGKLFHTVNALDKVSALSQDDQVQRIKLRSHCRSDQLGQARSSDRETGLARSAKVLGVVGIDRASYTIIVNCQTSRVAIEKRRAREAIWK